MRLHRHKFNAQPTTTDGFRFDSKKEAYTAMQKCMNWLQESDAHQYSKKQARDTIKVFHRDTAAFDKEAIIAEFQQPKNYQAWNIPGRAINLPSYHDMTVADINRVIDVICRQYHH